MLAHSFSTLENYTRHWKGRPQNDPVDINSTLRF